HSSPSLLLTLQSKTIERDSKFQSQISIILKQISLPPPIISISSLTNSLSATKNGTSTHNNNRRQPKPKQQPLHHHLQLHPHHPHHPHLRPLRRHLLAHHPHSPTTTTTTPTIFGFDIEWRPNFGRQFDNPVATIQLCTLSTTPSSQSTHSCLIFQIIHCPSPPKPLFDFLSNPNFMFVGIGIRSDVEQLLVDYDLNVKNVVDLGELAVQKIAGVKKGMGLKELSKPKNVTLSRWDYEWLSYAQIQYACIDAFLSFQIAHTLIPLPSVN
ncbi:Werner Syndrome-like exonuclease, partial [Bienertia sinuspersici]